MQENNTKGQKTINWGRKKGERKKGLANANTVKGTAKAIAVVFVWEFILLISEAKNKGKERVPFRGFNWEVKTNYDS